MHDGSFAAQAAELGDVSGRGYLAIISEGYRRCEGTFFCRKAERETIAELLQGQSTATFRGVVYEEKSDLGRKIVEVAVRGFRTEPDGLVVRLQAVGAWWKALKKA